jgi:hypothetical protein
VNVTHVPYRGSAPALQDLIAGRIDYHCLNAAAAIPHIEGRTAKAIAMLTKSRSPTFPNHRGNREVVQGGQVLRRQAGLIGAQSQPNIR